MTELPPPSVPASGARRTPSRLAAQWTPDFGNSPITASSIRWRLALPFIGVFFIVLLVFTVIVGFETRNRYVDQLSSDLAEQARLSYSLDQACLQGFARRDLTEKEAVDTSHGRPLDVAGIDGIYAAVAPDGRVIALLQDGASHTSAVVVLRPATLS